MDCLNCKSKVEGRLFFCKENHYYDEECAKKIEKCIECQNPLNALLKAFRTSERSLDGRGRLIEQDEFSGVCIVSAKISECQKKNLKKKQSFPQSPLKFLAQSD